MSEVSEMQRVTAKKVANRSKETKALMKKVTSSRESALDFLVRAGICTKAGKLAAPYR